MADEPTNGELGRSIGEVKAMVANLVGVREFNEYQRHVERRLDDLDGDIGEERKAREKGFEAIHTAEASNRQTARNAILTSIGGLVGMLVMAVVNGWLHLGGH